MALIWTAADQAAAQALLASNATSVDTSVQACTGISSTDKTAWTTFNTTLQAFCAQVPANFFPTGTEVLQTSGLAEQLQAYQTQLYAWQQKLSKTCSISVPLVNPAAQSGWQTTLQYAAVAAGILGTAWAVSSIVEETRMFKGPVKVARRITKRAAT